MKPITKSDIFTTEFIQSLNKQIDEVIESYKDKLDKICSELKEKIKEISE